MITKELKMHLLHYNRSQKNLEIISTYKIDKDIMGGAGVAGGKLLKEVSYIGYDERLKTLVIFFA
jgi:hypothetical protein